MSIYHHHEEVHNLTTPRQVVPTLVEIFQPKSVLDVGCGIGTWLKAFQEQGIHDFLGIDGSHVDCNSLKISSNHFIARDLAKAWDLNRRFDIAISLEVAEHLPETSSDVFVESLVKHADTIIFSAAIPGQGGQNHLNEQWPLYWQEKFSQHGFYFHDTLRHLFWNNNEVQWWYSQNIFLVNKKPNGQPVRSLVHPTLFTRQTRMLDAIQNGDIGVQQAFGLLVKSLRRWVGKKSEEH